MEGIKQKDGAPYMWGIPCTKDKHYKFSLAEYFGLTDWLCPYCDSHLSQENGKITCLNNCHINKNKNNKNNKNNKKEV